MIKQSAFSDVLEQAKGLGNQAQSGLSQAGNSISKWYGGLDPELKATLFRGLAGAAVGGAATGGLAAMTPGDRDNPKGVLGPALMGAVLGGGAAAGIPAGLKMLSGDIRLGGEQKQPLTSKLTDAVVNPVINNAIPIGAGAAGYMKGKGAYTALGDIMRTGVKDPKASTLTRLREALSPANAHLWRKERDVFGQIASKGMKAPPLRYSKGGLAALPIAVLLGLVADRYMKGKD